MSGIRRRHGVERIKLRALAGSLRTVWGNPGTRLGMWSHFSSQFSVTVFALLWGFPFLVQGLGWSTREASTLLMAMTAWAVVSGLVLARLVGRLPYYRSWIVVGVVLAMVVPWTAVLLWPGAAPTWLVVVMAFATASGGPASMVGFDLARSFSPLESLGRANGLVNVGGFSASLITMALVGIVLDLRQPGGMDVYDLDDFRAALSVQYVFWTLGIVQILRYRARGLDHLRVDDADRAGQRLVDAVSRQVRVRVRGQQRGAGADQPVDHAALRRGRGHPVHRGEQQRVVHDDEVGAPLLRLLDHDRGRVDGEEDLADLLPGVAADQTDRVPGLSPCRVVPLVEQSGHVTQRNTHGAKTSQPG